MARAALLGWRLHDVEDEKPKDENVEGTTYEANVDGDGQINYEESAMHSEGEQLTDEDVDGMT